MSDDTQNQLIYSADDVATLLDLKISTVRKYAVLLKKAGYHFYTNDKGHRGYYDRDVIVLRKLLEIKSHPDMTLENAADAVVSWVNQSNVSGSDTKNEISDERYIGYDEFKDFKEQQDQKLQQIIDLNQELLKRLDKQQEYINEQQKYIDERLNKQDERLEARDKRLMESLSQSVETQKQHAATQEKKDNWLTRLFKK